MANVTRLPTAVDALLSVEGNVYCVQEHKMGDAQSRGVQSILRGKGFLVQAGPSPRSGTTYTAGVATLSRGLRPMFHLLCRTKEGKEQ